MRIGFITKDNKELYSKQQRSDERIPGLKLELHSKFQTSRNWIENTLKWLQKKAIEKVKPKKKSLRLKFDKLIEEKQLLKELSIEETKNKSVNSDFRNPMRKIVYNNSSKKLTSDEEKLLELGLNFAITPKKFPLLEYITAAEDL